MRKAQREAILAKLEETYKGSKTALNYNSPFELLVAVILSAPSPFSALPPVI